jgi:hypothetical protein
MERISMGDHIDTNRFVGGFLGWSSRQCLDNLLQGYIKGLRVIKRRGEQALVKGEKVSS